MSNPIGPRAWTNSMVAILPPALSDPCVVMIFYLHHVTVQHGVNGLIAKNQGFCESAVTL